MNKNPGTAGTLISPIDPIDALAAATAEAGVVESAAGSPQQGATHEAPPQRFQPPPPPPAGSNEPPPETTWIEIELLSEEKEPVPGEQYRVELPDGTFTDGTLDNQGRARVEGFSPGSCKITFPQVDQAALESSSS